ncbi:MAG: PEP-CTERM sorting domain-containing protein [Gammaproteobacteria bacterium]
MTLARNPTAVSQANLSAQDFFGLRLQIETFAPGAPTPAATLGWRASSVALFSGLAALSGNDTQRAVALGPDGVMVAGIGRVLRVVNPSTVSGAAGYASFEPYLESLKSGPSTTVKGRYDGRQGVTGPEFVAQDYELQASVLADGTLELTGSARVVGAIAIRISEEELLKPGGIYGANPVSMINGAPHSNDNSVYDAIIRDILGGLNLGLVGNSATNPKTGNAYKDDPTDQWYAPPPIPADRAFAYAQPDHANFYNQFAAFLAPLSDAYGFAYSDLIQSPLADINPSRVDRMVITLLPDGMAGPKAVPEPGVLALLALGALALLRRRRGS